MINSLWGRPIISMHMSTMTSRLHTRHHKISLHPLLTSNYKGIHQGFRLIIFNLHRYQMLPSPMMLCMHRGQVRCCSSQGSTQSLWNSWAQDMILKCWNWRGIVQVRPKIKHKKINQHTQLCDQHNLFLTWPSWNSSRQMAQTGLELELLAEPHAGRWCWELEQPWEL